MIGAETAERSHQVGQLGYEERDGDTQDLEAGAGARPSAHGHSHSHTHGPAAPVSPHLRKVIAAVLIPFVVAILAGLVVLWPERVPPHEPTGVGFDQQTESGRVTRVEKAPCEELDVGPDNVPPGAPASAESTASPGTGQQGARSSGTSGGGTAAEPRGAFSDTPGQSGPGQSVTCERATIEVVSGKDKGRTFQEIVRPDQLRRYTAEQEVVLAYAPKAPRDLQYSVIDIKRGFPMALLAALFALAVIAVGRMRGLKALISLVVSFGVLTLFILPAIIQGANPLLVGVVGGSVIMLVAVYLGQGLSARTSVVALGTLVSLLLIGLLGSLFTAWAFLTGNTSDETGIVHSLFPEIEIRGLLLAGILIGSLGVLDDVTVTQTSAVWELKQANPSMTARELYRAGLRIGRDHIASTVNTLVLAYAGASLPLLLLFSIARSDVLTVAGSEVVAEEIVRTLVGSIGLVASVPVTTVLAALVASADPEKNPEDRRGPESKLKDALISTPRPASETSSSDASRARHGSHRRRR